MPALLCELHLSINEKADDSSSDKSDEKSHRPIRQKNVLKKKTPEQMLMKQSVQLNTHPYSRHGYVVDSG
jgi:hypothetical protein